MHQADPILAPEQLAALPHALLFDVRTGADAHAAYLQGHLPDAQFVDLERDLADVPADAARGGRHPLPQVGRFSALLGRWGVTPDTHVVLYDDQNGANAAARMWWMLRALGHARAQVLDGGLEAALAAGIPLSQELPMRHEAPPYPSNGWLWPQADREQVELARSAPEQLVLDVRAAARYRGEHEPIDPIAGHIPGAVNLPLTENLRADGRFKDASTLRAQYQQLLAARSPGQLVVHCGSGVTACHTLLALERAGLSGARLYVGSWSEWCRNPERPCGP